MTVVKIRCRDCYGVLTVPPDRAEILLCTTDQTLTTLGYRCPACGPQLHPLTPALIEALRTGGVPVREWEIEIELPPLPSITRDDLLEFHVHLDEEIAALLGGAA